VRGNRLISTTLAAVLALAACSSSWKVVQRTEDPSERFPPNELVGREVRFHMSSGDVRHLKVVEVVGMEARGFSPDTGSPTDTTTIDLREVVAAEAHHANEKTPPTVLAVVVAGVLLLAYLNPL